MGLSHFCCDNINDYKYILNKPTAGSLCSLFTLQNVPTIQIAVATEVSNDLNLNVTNVFPNECTNFLCRYGYRYRHRLCFQPTFTRRTSGQNPVIFLAENFVSLLPPPPPPGATFNVVSLTTPPVSSSYSASSSSSSLCLEALTFVAFVTLLSPLIWMY